MYTFFLWEGFIKPNLFLLDQRLYEGSRCVTAEVDFGSRIGLFICWLVPNVNEIYDTSNVLKLLLHI